MTDEELRRAEAKRLIDVIGDMAFEMGEMVLECDAEDIDALMEVALIMREYATDLWDRLMRLRRETRRAND